MFKPAGHRGNVPVPPTPNQGNLNNEDSGEDWSDDEFDEEQETYQNVEPPAPAAPAKLPPRPVPLPPKVDSQPSLPPLPPRGGLTPVRPSGEFIKDALKAALAERCLPATPVAKPSPAASSSSNTFPRTGCSRPPLPPPLVSGNSVEESCEEVYEMTDSPPPPPVPSSRPLPPPPTAAPKAQAQRPRIPSENDDDNEYLDADEMAPSRAYPKMMMIRPIPLPPLPEPPLPDGTRVMSGGTSTGAEFDAEDQDVYESGDMYTGADDPDIAQFNSRPPFPNVKIAALPVPDNKLARSTPEPRTNKKPEIPGSRPVPTLPPARPLPEPGLRNTTPKITKSLPSVNETESSGGPPTPARPLPIPPPSKGPETAGNKKLEIPQIKTPNRRSAADAETESSTVSSELLDIKSRLKPVKMVVKSADPEAETEANTVDAEKPQSLLGVKKQPNEGYERNSSSYRSRSPAGRDCRDPPVFKPSPGSTECIPGLPVSDRTDTEHKSHPSGSMVRGQSFQVAGSTDDMGASATGSRRPSAPVVSMSAPQRPRLVERPLPRVPGEGIPPPVTPLRPVPDHVESAEEDLSGHRWYIGQVNRKEAEAKLKDLGQDGAFVVRISQNGGVNNPYTLTLLYRNNPYNLHIRKRTDGKYAIGNEKPDEIVFPAVPDLINFYLNNVIDLIGDSRRSIAAGRVTLKICYAK